MSLRYSIYKVQTFRFELLLAANFYILAHHVEFVKCFFQVFSNSFCARHTPDRSPSSRNLIYMNTGDSKNQEVLPVFRTPVSVTSATGIYYHGFHHLSSIFYNFLCFILVFLTEVQCLFSGGQTTANLYQSLSCLYTACLFSG